MRAVRRPERRQNNLERRETTNGRLAMERSEGRCQSRDKIFWTLQNLRFSSRRRLDFEEIDKRRKFVCAGRAKVGLAPIGASSVARARLAWSVG